ncbi:MAG: methyltransferase domain-containing protein [Nanoarchaeota archaeon]|nr:methyltransferase domain-containing protein [Nanoarchaeota archaeon]
MKYLFILGRNPELSVKEIFAYFSARSLEILSHKLIENGLLIDLDGQIGNIVDELGGVISIGQVIVEGNLKDLIKKLDKITLYPGKENKFNYVVWGFCEEEYYYELGGYLRARFKEEKLKTSEKPLTGLMELQSGNKIKIVGNRVSEQFFLFSSDSENFFFGKIIYEFNSSEVEKRDMNKPSRRSELAISPRLAKIMLNLANVKENDKIIDPFCGVGIILTEALLKKIKVVGIDFDINAIEGAEENLSWNKFNKNDYKLISDDSRKIKINTSFSALVCEPDFGELLRKIPTEANAKKTIKNYEDLMISVINNLKRNVHGKFVFTAPLILMFNRKRKRANIERITQETGLKLADGFPIDDLRKDQIVGREIIVLEQ